MSNSEDKVGCMFAIFKLLGLTPGSQIGSKGEESLPYRVRDDFLSPAERAFFGVLTQCVPDGVLICPKVRVGDILYVVQRRDNMAHVNRIDRKHIDFLLVSRTSLQPLTAIELDDASHQRQDRAERDEFLDRAFQTAGLPLLHFPVQRGYTLNDIKAILAPHLNPGAAASTTAPTATIAPTGGAPAVPLCRKCGIPMVVRSSSRGTNQGRQFYGCKNYPQCREIVNIT